MRSVFGSAQTPFGICGFGYVDEGLPKDQALKKLRFEMENNQALKFFLSTQPPEKRRQIVQEIVDSIMGKPEDKSLENNNPNNLNLIEEKK
ncbi:MAG: hypothetical protein K5866_12045 [Treponema sp.]|nr:hypothetical protein [Treponema sp.]